MRKEMSHSQSPQPNPPLSSANYYKTQNLYEASFLLAKGFNLSGKEKAGSKVVLLFEYKPEISEAAMAFYNGSLIQAKKFSDAYRTLKDFVFER
jgi:hypothetical protein